MNRRNHWILLGIGVLVLATISSFARQQHAAVHKDGLIQSEPVAAGSLHDREANHPERSLTRLAFPDPRVVSYRIRVELQSDEDVLRAIDAGLPDAVRGTFLYTVSPDVPPALEAARLRSPIVAGVSYAAVFPGHSPQRLGGEFAYSRGLGQEAVAKGAKPDTFIAIDDGERPSREDAKHLSSPESPPPKERNRDTLADAMWSAPADISAPLVPTRDSPANGGAPTGRFDGCAEDFEGSFPGNYWFVGDNDSGDGEDYWDDVSCRSYEGSWSAWCADIGDQSNCVNYDDNMDAYMFIECQYLGRTYQGTNLFRYVRWVEAENGYDYFFYRVFGYIANPGHDNWPTPHCYFELDPVYDTGGQWQSRQLTLNSCWDAVNYVRLEFWFHSDGSVNSYEGAYLDNLSFSCASDEALYPCEGGFDFCPVDGCDVDYSVTAPYTSPTRNTCGAVDNCDICGSHNEDHTYEVYIPSSGDWTFSLCGSSYDTRLDVGTTPGGSEICCNDDYCGLQSECTENISAGTYYVVVDGYSSNCGDYVLTVYPYVVPPTLVGSGCYVTPTVAEPGDTITVFYRINNLNSTNVTVGLGSSIIGCTTGQTHISQSCDHYVSAPPGESTHSRCFAVPSYAAYELNDVIWCIWEDIGVALPWDCFDRSCYLSVEDLTAPTTPGTPYMYASSDTGQSSSDRITRETKPTFGWSASSDAGSGVAGYRVSYTDSTPDSDDYWTDTNSWTPGLFDPPIPEGSHTLYVRAFDNVGNPSSAVSQVDLTIDTTPTPPPTFLAPSEGEEVCDTTPTLQWAAENDVWKYQVYVREDQFPWLDDRISPELSASSWTAFPPLAYKPWSWQVKAWDIAGNEGCFGKDGQCSIPIIFEVWGHFVVPSPACGKENVECLAADREREYDNRTGVARLLIGSAPICTAWIIGSPNCLITNRHCITVDGSISGPLYNVTVLKAEFDYEYDECTGGACPPTTKFNVTALIHDNPDLDFALLAVEDDPAATFGTLTVSCDPIQMDDACYLIHHASGGPKAYDDGFYTNTFTPGSCNTPIGPETVDSQVRYSLLGKGGASGAPVFSAQTHAVEAINHCGVPCSDNDHLGIPMSAILADALPAIENQGCVVNVANSPTSNIFNYGVSGATVTVNESFDVFASLDNSGQAGDHGGISISFPDLTETDDNMPPYNSSNADVATHPSTSFDTVGYFDNGDEIFIDGNPGPAQHLLVEGDEESWSPGETHTLRLTVTPRQPGSLEIRLRGWICKCGELGYGPPCERDPDSGGAGIELDQQLYWSYVLTVNVVACDDHADCSDGVFCNGEEACQAGACTSGAPVDCTYLTDECNTGECNEDAERCEAHPRPAGTACGDPNDTECDNPDSCDAFGTCQENRKPDATTCDDDLFCNGQDWCSGGACSGHAGNPCIGGPECNNSCNESPDNCYSASGAACGDPGSADCDDPDTCDGAGGCASNYLPSGTPCGDPTDDECTDPDTCDGLGICLDNHTCIVPTGSEPPNGAIDARQPTDLECTQTFGWDSIVINFDEDASGVQCSNFTITVCPPDVDPPNCLDVVPDGNTATLVLDDRIPTKHWTILTHASGWSTKIGYLPADVTGDGTSGPLDILRLIDCLNGVATCETWQCDVNRSDECNSADILTVIDLLNGAGCFDPWNGETLPDCP